MGQYSSQIKAAINDEDEYLDDSGEDDEGEGLGSEGLDASALRRDYSDEALISPANRAERSHGLFLRRKQRSKTGMVDRVFRGSDQSSVVHLESYRGYLMSQLGREEVISQLKVAREPEVFADPPALDLEAYVRSDPESEEVQAILRKHHDSQVPRRTKMLLDDLLRRSDLDPSTVVSFTTNSNMVYALFKQIEPAINWYFTKVQNVNMFHPQLQQNERDLARSQDKIDYQMCLQNHFKGATNALRELYATEVKERHWLDPSGNLENYLSTEDGKPIYLRQLLFISSLFPVKCYGLLHRYFETSGRRLLLQSEVQQLFPFKQFPAFDLGRTYQQVVEALQRTVKASERCFQLVELRFAIHKTLMTPVLAKIDASLSLEVRVPEPCLIALMFKLDHQVRRTFGLEPNTTVRHKTLFRRYWRKLIDQEEDQTEMADLEAASAFLLSQGVPVDLAEPQGSRDSIAVSSREGSDMTVLPEEIAVISVGSEDPTAAQHRKERAL